MADYDSINYAVKLHAFLGKAAHDFEAIAPVETDVLILVESLHLNLPGRDVVGIRPRAGRG